MFDRILKYMLILSVLVVAAQLRKIVKRADDDKSVEFDVKIVNVDSSSAELELFDDNKTTINYLITYTLTGNRTLPVDVVGEAKTVSIVSKNSFKMQTNSLSMLAQQEQLLSDDDSVANLKSKSNDSGDSGELYTNDDKALIRSKSYEEVHRFLVPDLEPNREYHLSLNIQAKEAHLSSLLTGVAKPDKPRKATEKQFEIMFKTTFDYDLTASLACKGSAESSDNGGQRLTKSDNHDDVSSSCYVKDTNCTKCKPTCYEVKRIRNQANSKQKVTEDPAVIKPILCEACPCDTSRSTGECYVTQSSDQGSSSDTSSSGGFTPKCKQCIDPYVGGMCNECLNDGIDYYKNEKGECVKCFCNNNAALDVNPRSTKRRKCRAITGVCIDCLFNTTGKQCDKCLAGYNGDPLKRTCVEYKAAIRNSSSAAQEQSQKSQQLDLNEKYSYKKLAIFSLYIFCMLTLVLFTFLCIKSHYYNSNHMLKNSADTAQSPAGTSNFRMQLNSMLASLDQSTKPLRARVSIYFGSICPTTMRFVRVASNQANAGYSNANVIGTNDEDRLNLAEYQMFDDSLLHNTTGDEATFTYRATFSDDLDDSQNDTRNPYRSLTIKT